MKEHPIIFTPANIRAILEGRKTQTRRVAKWKPREAGLNLDAASLSVGYYHTGVPSSGFVLRSMGGSCWNDRTYPLHCPYGVPGDRLVIYCKHETSKRRRIKGDPNISERGLHGGIRRSDLLADQVCGVRQEGTDRVVSPRGSQECQGLPDGQPISQQCEGDENRAPAGLHGVSRNAAIANFSISPSRRKAGEQQTGQSLLGDAGRKLARPAGARKTIREPDVQIHPAGARAHSMGDPEGILLATSGRTYFGRCPVLDPTTDGRLIVEITDVRVQRVQEISHRDAVTEGIAESPFVQTAFARLWNSINAKTHPWSENPWVWCLTFRKL